MAGKLMDEGETQFDEWQPDPYKDLPGGMKPPML